MSRASTAVVFTVVLGTMTATPQFATADIALAVGKDLSPGNDVRFQVAWGGPWHKAADRAVKRLEADSKARGLRLQHYWRPHNKICGAEVDTGYYVVVQWKGVRETRFGLGASSRSYAEAKKRALNMLELFTDGRFKRSRQMHQITVVQQRRF